ncbi:ATP-binding protein [Gloeothece verrucosa]|nr:anti-sigma regulatory factor [Gloeothece verrucosa]
MSFASTLYLCPVLDLLLANIPKQLQPEIRLGLQEALVNAAKHGNKLDPSKTVVVQFSVTKEGYSWVISDQGSGFATEQVNRCNCDNDCDSHCDSHSNSHSLPDLPPEESESGRGLCILHQIFDQVHWNRQGTQLRLSKQIKKGKRQPLFN